MKNLLKVLFVLIVFSFVFSLNIGLYAKHEVKKTEEIKCAVCNSIIKGEVKIKTEYKGKTYYFSSEECKAKFEKNPEKYATCTHEVSFICPNKECKYKSDKPGKCPKCGQELKKYVHEAFYVCPMKQCNYKTDKPGKCPKCGMKLKKVSECAHHHKHEHKDDHKHEHDHY